MRGCFTPAVFRQFSPQKAKGTCYGYHRWSPPQNFPYISSDSFGDANVFFWLSKIDLSIADLKGRRQELSFGRLFSAWVPGKSEIPGSIWNCWGQPTCKIARCRGPNVEHTLPWEWCESCHR
jgi:hypothetical protein